ncbi:MAG: hypothetical protein ACLUIQ_00635 [Dialister invisus]
MPEDAMNDVHEIADSVTESKEAATKDNMGKQVGEGDLQKSWVWQRYGFQAVMDLDMAPEQVRYGSAAVQVPVVEMVQSRNR